MQKNDRHQQQQDRHCQEKEMDTLEQMVGAHNNTTINRWENIKYMVKGDIRVTPLQVHTHAKVIFTYLFGLYLHI